MVTVNLDDKQMLAGDDGRSARPYPEYSLMSKLYNYGFRLQPYEPSMGKTYSVACHKLPIIVFK